MTLSRRTLLKYGSLGLLQAILPPLPVTNFYTDGDRALPVTRKPAVKFARVLQWSAILRSEPSLNAPQVGSLKRDGVLPIYAEVTSDSGSAYNKLWYEVEGGYIYSAMVQPVRWELNKAVTDAGTDGFWAEVTVPFVDSRSAPSVKAPVTQYRYYGSTVYKVIKAIKSQDKPEDVKASPLPYSGSTQWWYQVEDESFPGNYFVPASHLRPISSAEFMPISAGVDGRDKKIVVRLREQRLIAYERETEVFSCRTATGTYFKDQNTGEDRDFTTTPGTWSIFRKTPSQHMYGGAVGDDHSFDLPGIPWVSYFTGSGIAVHGTYWHNDFGVPRSHGCVNVSSDNSKWVWRWTLPLNDPKRRYITLDGEKRKDVLQATTVIVQ